MKINTCMENGSLIILLSGELDECSAEYVRKTIDFNIVNKAFEKVVFDMKSVSFMDSTGIGVLLGRYNLLKRMGIPCCVKNCSKHIDKILTMSGIYRVIKKAQ